MSCRRNEMICQGTPHVQNDVLRGQGAPHDNEIKRQARALLTMIRSASARSQAQSGVARPLILSATKRV